MSDEIPKEQFKEDGFYSSASIVLLAGYIKRQILNNAGQKLEYAPSGEGIGEDEYDLVIRVRKDFVVEFGVQTKSEDGKKIRIMVEQ